MHSVLLLNVHTQKTTKSEALALALILPLQQPFSHQVQSSSCCCLTPSCVVPAQPSHFEAEAELDSRIRLSWLWPVPEPITSLELLWWEASSPTDKVSQCLQRRVSAVDYYPPCDLSDPHWLFFPIIPILCVCRFLLSSLSFQCLFLCDIE